MHWYLVVWMLMTDGSWVQGEMVGDGWHALKTVSEYECIKRRDKANYYNLGYMFRFECVFNTREGLLAEKREANI